MSHEKGKLEYIVTCEKLMGMKVRGRPREMVLEKNGMTWRNICMRNHWQSKKIEDWICVMSKATWHGLQEQQEACSVYYCMFIIVLLVGYL